MELSQAPLGFGLGCALWTADSRTLTRLEGSARPCRRTCAARVRAIESDPAQGFAYRATKGLSTMMEEASPTVIDEFNGPQMVRIRTATDL